MNWYIGPWIWDAKRTSWNPPAGFSGIDLRTLEQMATADGTPGLGLFAGKETLDGNYALLGSGAWDGIRLATREKDIIPVRRGYAVEGDTLQQVILNLMTNGADPDGLECCKPIFPTAKGTLELHLAGQVHREAFQWGTKHTNILRDVLRKEFDQHFKEANDGKLNDAEHHLRILDYWCDKYKVDKSEGWKVFVPDVLQNDVSGPLKHSTSYTENFDGADSGSVMGHQLTWTAAAGTFANYNNTGYKAANNGSFEGCRADHDLSSADHYSQMTLANPAGAAINGDTDFTGPAARFNSSANTYYFTSNYAGQQYITKVVAGTSTNLANAASTFGSTNTYKVEANGSTIKGYVNGAEVVSVSDSSITGNTRCGIFAVGSNRCWDDFECADLAAGASFAAPSLIHSQAVNRAAFY